MTGTSEMLKKQKSKNRFLSVPSLPEVSHPNLTGDPPLKISVSLCDRGAYLAVSSIDVEISLILVSRVDPVPLLAYTI